MTMIEQDDKIICEYEHCRAEVDRYDSFVMEWWHPSEYDVNNLFERHHFCSFKCGANYMHHCEYG